MGLNFLRFIIKLNVGEIILSQKIGEKKITNIVIIILTTYHINKLGICQASLYTNVYELLSNFPREYLIYKNIGLGFSGIVINILRYITIFFFAEFDIDEHKKRAYELLLFYSICILFSLISTLIVVVCEIIFSYFP